MKLFLRLLIACVAMLIASEGHSQSSRQTEVCIPEDSALLVLKKGYQAIELEKKIKILNQDAYFYQQRIIEKDAIIGDLKVKDSTYRQDMTYYKAIMLQEHDKQIMLQNEINKRNKIIKKERFRTKLTGIFGFAGIAAVIAFSLLKK